MRNNSLPLLFLQAPRGLQQLALRALIASVVVSAAMGIFALLVGEFEETQSKLLATSLSVSGAAIVAMACGFAWGRGRLGLMPPAGIAAGVGGFGLLTTNMWLEVESEIFLRSTFTVLVLAFAATHACVVSPLGLFGRFRWIFGATYCLNALLSALVIVAIHIEPAWNEYWRLLGAVVILLVATTIATPVLRRLDKTAHPTTPVIDLPSGAMYCPNCGDQLTHRSGKTCSSCGASFKVQIHS
jgi:hypothetical protein